MGTKREQFGFRPLGPSWLHQRRSGSCSSCSSRSVMPFGDACSRWRSKELFPLRPAPGFRPGAPSAGPPLRLRTDLPQSPLRVETSLRPPRPSSRWFQPRSTCRARWPPSMSGPLAGFTDAFIHNQRRGEGEPAITLPEASRVDIDLFENQNSAIITPMEDGHACPINFF